MQCEKEAIESRIGNRSEWVDAEAKNFLKGGAGISTLKCTNVLTITERETTMQIED